MVCLDSCLENRCILIMLAAVFFIFFVFFVGKVEFIIIHEIMNHLLAEKYDFSTKNNEANYLL